MKTVIIISPGLWILFETSGSAEHGQVGRVIPSTESEDSNKRDGRSEWRRADDFIESSCRLTRRSSSNPHIGTVRGLRLGARPLRVPLWDG